MNLSIPTNFQKGVTRLSLCLCISFVLFTGCYTSPDEEKQAYQKKLESFQVTSYKGAKSVIRASSNVQTETTSLDKLLGVKSNDEGGANEIMKWIAQLDASMKQDGSPQSVETIDYLKLSKDIWGLQEAMKDSDEDKYPLFLERAAGKENAGRVDSLFNSYGFSYNNSTEHLVFAVIGAVSVKTPPEIVLYELSMVNEKELGQNELLLFKQLLQSFYFSMNGLNHMAEENADATIKSMHDHKYSSTLLMKPSVNGQAIFQQEDQAQSCMQMMAYAMRAYTRYRLGGDEKLQQAEDDILQAAELANRSGIQSDELTLVAALYCLKSDNPDKAKELCNQLMTKSANQDNKRLAEMVLSELEKSSQKQAIGLLEENQSKNDFILSMLKEYAFLTIDKNGLLSQRGYSNEPNVKAYLSFLEEYMKESEKFSQYADPDYYEEKIKGLLEK